MHEKGQSVFLKTAIEAAHHAGKYIVDNIGKITEKDIACKQLSDFVTRIDVESEKIIIEIIKKKFPNHLFLAEESVVAVDRGIYKWIIDPLDGTTNFIHGYPVFSVSIALKYYEEIILGIVFDPTREELFTAEKGKGAFLNEKPISVSSMRKFSNSLIATAFPFRKKELIDPYITVFKGIFSRVSDIRRAGSAALDLAYLACGRCDGFFEIGLSPWDIAAGAILIKEAGGVITDFGGDSDYLETGNVVAGIPSVHNELLKEVKRVFSGIIDK